MTCWEVLDSLTGTLMSLSRKVDSFLGRRESQIYSPVWEEAFDVGYVCHSRGCAVCGCLLDIHINTCACMHASMHTYHTYILKLLKL